MVFTLTCNVVELITVWWEVTCCLSLQGRNQEEADSFIILADLERTTRCHVSEDGKYNYRQVTRTTALCRVPPDICRCSVWILRHAIILVCTVLRLLLYFWKICAPLAVIISKFT
jgi:hypothetical protein